MSKIAKHQAFVDAAIALFDDVSNLTMADLKAVKRNNPGLTIPVTVHNTGAKALGAKVKTYDLTTEMSDIPAAPKKTSKPRAPKVAVEAKTSTVVQMPTVVEVPVVQPTLTSYKLTDNESFCESAHIPEINPNYILWGNHSKIVTIMKSRQFFPALVTGHTGNGKTEMIEQIAAKAKRALIRVNLTAESDESKLMGAISLVDGNTVWKDGPVVTAMRNGAILLLDEIDLAGENLLCLQSVMEGKSYMIKKTGEVVKPAEGFTVIATANTTGAGNTTGRYHGTKIMNAAFLDRINITFKQNYPTASVEAKILKSIASTMIESIDEELEGFITALAKWANSIRKGFDDETIEEVISTRRLISVLKTYFMFNDIDYAVDMSIARYDEDTQLTFKALWRACFVEPTKEIPVPDAPRTDWKVAP